MPFIILAVTCHDKGTNKVRDALLVMMSSFVFGDLLRHGMRIPKFGQLLLKSKTGQSAVIDVRTVGLIKEGTIKVRTFPLGA
jgi:indole-3-pyruvate monooxygenase